MDRERTAEDLFERLDRERQAADRQYNDALTALDRALTRAPRAPVAAGIPRRQPGRASESGMEDPARGRRRPPIVRSRAACAGSSGACWGRRSTRSSVSTPPSSITSIATSRRAEEAARAAAALVDAARRELEAVVRFEWLLLQFLQTVTAYVDTKDRSAGGPELRDQVGLIQQRLVMVERELTSRESSVVRLPPPLPAPPRRSPISGRRCISVSKIASAAPRRTSADGSTSYLPLFAAATDVLDVGCGRGELLELFREHGVTARGIDTNQAMVDECRSRGLAVERADALSFLEGRQDGSLGGLIAIQVVEHLEPAYLVRVLGLAYQKLRPGRAARPRNDQPGMLDGVLRVLHPRSHARAAAASRHAAVPGSGQRVHRRQHRIPAAGHGSRPSRSRPAVRHGEPRRQPQSPRPSTPTPTNSTRGCFRRWITP